MSDKNRELNILTKALDCQNVKGDIPTNIHEILRKNIDIIDSDGERPDFIIMAEDEVIGIEHCQVDLFFRIKRKKAQSMVGKQEKKIDGLIEKYSDKNLLESDIKNGKALKEALNLVEERYEHRTDFEYDKFINNFKRVCLSHNDNCADYKKRVKDYAPGRNNTLACLIELPYSKELTYIITDDKGTREQAIRGVPITKDMLKIISQMNGFDFIILFMDCFSRSRKKEHLCYYFVPKNINLCIKQQGIKPINSFDLKNSFGLPFKTDIDFPEEYIINEDGTTTYKVEVKKRPQKKNKA